MKERNDIIVSYLKKLGDAFSSNKTLVEVLSEIKNDSHKNYTELLHNLYENKEYELYSIKKKALPSATFCASFEKNNRKKSGLLNYNCIMILDVDKIGKKKMNEVLSVFSKDKYIFAFWKSPSQDGVKGLLSIDYLDTEINNETTDYHHKRCFRKLKDYFFNEYNIELDNSGSDFTRLCFISYDKNLILKSNYEKFQISESEYSEVIKKNNQSKIKSATTKNIHNRKFILNNTIGKNKSKDKTEIRKIIHFLEKNNLSVTNSYDNWLKIAFAIANTFSFDLGKMYFLKISKQDSLKFNEKESLMLLEECYYCSRGEICFSTIIHLAQERGYELTERVPKQRLFF